MDFLMLMAIVIPIVYFVMLLSHKLVLLFMTWMGWTDSEWFNK